MLVAVCRTLWLFLPHMKPRTLLFIGDSITDAGRRDDPELLGFGYVRLVHDLLCARHPATVLQVRNMGIGGDTIRHLARRWDRDVLQHRPDALSISIGVNDVWRQLQTPENPEAVPCDEFLATYRALLTRTSRALPRCRMFLCEPTPVGEERETPHNRLIGAYLHAVADIAAEFGANLVPMARAFWDAKDAAPGRMWTTDGVHPLSHGHMLMAQTFVDVWERVQ